MARHSAIIVILTLLVAGCTPTGTGVPGVDLTAVAPSGFVESGGIGLRYFIEGEGTPVMVIGTATLTAHTLSSQLREHLQFIFADLQSRREAGSLEGVGMDTLVEAMDRLREELGLQEMGVLGHSAAGLIALEYARRYPERTTFAIVIAAPPTRTVETQGAQMEFWASDASPVRKAILAEKRKAPIAADTPQEFYVQERVVNSAVYWYDPLYDEAHLWKDVPLDIDLMNYILHLILNESDPSEGFDEITVPVFLALGRYDYAIPYSLWDEPRHLLADLSYNLFEHSGHYPMFEEQQTFDAKLLEWLRER